MSTHGPNQIARAARQVRRLTSASLMSDTKWRRLIVALDRPELNLSLCLWKFLGEDHERPAHMPRAMHLYPPRPWIDAPSFGPVPLRSIERLRIPRLIPRGAHRQDVDAAAALLESLGRFPIALSDAGLRIDGHVPIGR